MNKNISSLQCAYDYLVKCGGERTFAEIWNHVVETLEIEDPNSRISAFYTNLTLDGRFVTLGENVWDLRTRQKFEKVHIDMKDVYAEIDSNTDDSDAGDEDENENNDEDDEIVEESY